MWLQKELKRMRRRTRVVVTRKAKEEEKRGCGYKEGRGGGEGLWLQGDLRGIRRGLVTIQEELRRTSLRRRVAVTRRAEEDERGCGCKKN